MATSFLTMASRLSATPEPAYKQAEYAFYLEDLQPKLVLVARPATTRLRGGNESRHPGREIRFEETDPAGWFTLWDEEADTAPAAEDAEALVLHTSGTTSRPKVVPLTQPIGGVRFGHCGR